MSSTNFVNDHASGGLSNYLYICELNSPSSTVDDGDEAKSNKVLIKLYGESHKQLSYFLTDVLVATIMSSSGLGPKIYGVFQSGRLEQLLDASSTTILVPFLRLDFEILQVF